MIYFIGAGPGDPELLTLKGKKLIDQADVIIYAGSLVNPAVLADAKKSAKILNSATMDLDEVIAEMEDAESKGLMLARVHTGDPSIYGAIREQFDRLDKLGIKYKYIPGVSSFLGVASALNAEYTLPNVTQTVILTRMAGRTPVPERESIAKLASHKATMIIFLSVGMIADLSKELMQGYEPETPVAVVYKATWPEQKIVRSTLENIAEDVKKAGITKTALIVVSNTLGSDYELSKLYDKHFTHEFREAKA